MNKNVLETHIISKIAKQYNFTEGINKILKQRFGSQILPSSKIIGDINIYNI
jgi:hypothetical protein